jgi:hypothetical protein
MKYFSTAIDGKPVLADNGDRFTAFVTKLQSMMSAGSVAYTDDMLAVFEEGSALFYIGTLENASVIKGSYGIMPLPKLDAEQEKYYTYSNENAKVYTVLTTNNKPERVPNVLRALNATGDIVQVGWARDLLDYALRDAKSYDTVRFVFNNATYDFAYMYGGSYASIADSSYNAMINTAVYGGNHAEQIKKASAQLAKDISAIYP